MGEREGLCLAKRGSVTISFIDKMYPILYTDVYGGDFCSFEGLWYTIANMQDLVGFALPFIVDVINKKFPDSPVRFIIVLLSCIGAATLLNLDKLQSGDWGEILGKVGIIFTESQIIYHLYWKDSQARFKVFGAMKSF